MVRLRNIIVFIVLFVNLVTCEDKQICIYTEGGKICSSAESSELTQSQDAATGDNGHGESAADDTGPIVAAEETAASVNATYGEVNTSKKESGEAAEANTNKQGSSIVVAEANSTKQESSFVAVLSNTNIDNSSVVVSKENALQEISVEPNSGTLSNETAEIQIPVQMVAKKQTSEIVAEGINPAEAVATGEELEIADSISDPKSETSNQAPSQSGEATSNLSPEELVAVAEGIVIAGALYKVANAAVPPAANLSPAQEVALAEGLEMADAVLQGIREDEPAVNAIWRAALEAESTWKQDGVPVNEDTLDKGLMAFLVCVMIVLAITGSVSGWVLYTRLSRSPEEDKSQNMYILIDASAPESTFVDCPLDLNDSEGVSYTFPRVINDTLS